MAGQPLGAARRFAEVTPPTNPSTYPLLSLICNTFRLQVSLSAPRAKFDVEVREEALQLLGKAGEVFFFV